MSDSGITRREFLRNSAVLGGMTILTPSMLQAGEPPRRRPNIVFILSDDQLRGLFGCYGSKAGLTPNLDRLAAHGVRFTSACVTSSLCAPSRASCLTGRYAGRFAPVVRNDNGGFPESQPTVASILRTAGYQTGFVGKAHFKISGLTGVKNLDDRLKRIGFTFVENAHPYDDSKGVHLNRQPKAFDSAIKFITANQDRPFALFLFTTLTHGPHEAPQKYIDMAKVRDNNVGKAMYCWLDDLVGRVVGTVDKLGIRERTVILFSGDNAPASWRGNRGKLEPGDRNKSTLYDGWVPQVVSWPGHFKEGTVLNELVQNVDFMPTILDVCGVRPPVEARPDGMSFLPLVTDKAVKWREAAFFEMGVGRAVRTDRWKYIALRPLKGMWGKFEKQLIPYGGEKDLLFDLEKDPGESNNLFKDPAHAKVVKNMQARLCKLCAGYNYKFGEFGGGV